MTLCELCSMYAGPNSVCDHTKNGYCQVFKFEAAKDAKTYNMHQSIQEKKL